MTAMHLILAVVALGLTPAPPAVTTTDTPAVRASSAVALAPGTFLVATRKLMDPNFARTVVLLVDYDSDGAMGVVINRETELTLSDALPELEPPEANDGSVFLGGPVSPQGLVLIVRSAEKPGDSVQVVDEVWVSHSRDLLESLVADEESKLEFRVYAGYSGWAPRQLDAEVARGEWYVFPADANTVFSDRPARVWRTLVPPVENPNVTQTFSGPRLASSRPGPR
jgi:putative transcriptional regulator